MKIRKAQLKEPDPKETRSLLISILFEQHFRLASTLLEKETLDLQKIIEVLGERPFPPKSNYKAYLEIKKEDQQTTSQ
ncbi:unnamed protein product (macronuclear) [Paramecium tetraurelia]|uniref:Uncharacterized protein n=1 Tax=Paramecium tetraurelia TaxID=5888 RepID=A0C6J9_PARTE|nr:uncharacterized protein GSPATT00035545001 [Paramecium tetraurelia]CAK66416.1 unnamed protein product [Paramecium tetraurelia]|eukprot:XP_001433813.1 hypothetical protein (macronuclear) [Paramecium tetraurelia strain d4-2]